MSFFLRTSILFALSSLAVACAASSDEDPSAPPSTDTLAAASRSAISSFKGTYEVPTTDPALAEAATFDVTVKMQANPDGSLRLHYDLPATLVGTDTKIDMRAVPTATGFDMAGAQGTGKCTVGLGSPSGPGSGLAIECQERFPSMIVDTPAVEAALDASGVTGDARTARLAVSARFGVDPIGVLRFSTKRH